MVLAQIIMVLALILMISGKVPLYLTAIIGSITAAIVAGFPLAGPGQTVAGLLQGSLHPVILDMLGVLVFVGVMEKAGFLNAIIFRLMHAGAKMGGGPGVVTAGGISAGIIGGLTGFTQPAITGVITGPPAIKLGVDKNIAAGILAHAGHLGNFGGFTHPTIVAIIATAGITFGTINIVGALTALSIFALSYIRLRRIMQKEGLSVTGANVKFDNEENTNIPFLKAIFPFIVLLAGFIAGIPVVVMGLASALLTICISSRNFKTGEKDMLDGLTRITVPLFATITFLFMGAIINAVGLSAMIGNALEPFLDVAPITMMFIVGSLAGLILQSNAASIPIVVPFLTIVLATGVNPVVAAIAAAAGPAIMQYYLSGGPVAALATVIPIIPGSDLKVANSFQRPSILFGLLVAYLLTMLVALIF